MRWEYLLTGLVACAAVVALDQLLNTRLLRQRRFWVYLAVMLVCQVIFDGYLTARPVTLYDPCCYLGPRVLTLPVEEFPFGVAFLGLVVVLWQWSGRLLGPAGEAPGRHPEGAG